MARTLWAAAVLSLTVPLPTLAQTGFVAAARAGTARYRDREVAVADGYRPVGPDFPGMGEHWINPFLLVTGELDPARPPVLEYADIGGRPALVGVAYAALVTDTAMPGGLPVPPEAWHTHAGKVDEESFILAHAGVHAAHQHLFGPRVAVVHAWIWLDNPAGLFETDNWALPFARLGLVAPTGISADAGRGLSLAVGGGGGRSFGTLIRISGRPDSAEQARLAVILDSAGAALAARVRSGASGAAVSADQVESFAALWRRSWALVLRAASPAVRERLAALDAR